jgi:asparagine synthase (glutamine-hydrolysing)
VCGIAGTVGAGASEEVLWGQLRLLEHRGPDASGVFKGGLGAIGQTRLAVIDLVTGDPPVTSEDGTIGAVLNGEIYNYRELRKSLLGAGHVLASNGDTEVIAHLAEQDDPVEVARHLDGMFAFAVWDTVRQRLVLGRDRLGKKPLYYWSDSKSIVFGSEIKAVLAHPGVPHRMESDALAAYLTFGYVPTPRTFFDGIRSVPPANVLVFEPGLGLRLQQYWEPVVPPRGANTRVPRQDATGAVRAALSSAVERRLTADVPVGAFLSGGLDSSTVVALMAKLSPSPVATFTIGFEDAPGFDERRYAAAVSHRYRTEHTELVVKPDASSLIERLVWHHDQPFGDSSALPTYLLSELASKHVKVVLSGDGGDELFAGYERFAAARILSAFQRLPPPAQDAAQAGLGALAKSRLARTAPGSRVLEAQRLISAKDQEFPEAFLSWVCYVPEPWRTQLCPGGSRWALQDYRNIWRRGAGAAFLDQLLLLNMRTYLLDDLLPKVDRMAMAHGLEVRSPFLDTALVELALRIPPSAKLRFLSGKRVLRQAARDLLPPEVLARRKHGFGLPLDAWFRGELRGYIEGRLLAPSARARSYLEGDALDRLGAEHLSGGARHGHLLWTLATLEEFLRKQGW